MSDTASPEYEAMVMAFAESMYNAKWLSDPRELAAIGCALAKAAPLIRAAERQRLQAKIDAAGLQLVPRELTLEMALAADATLPDYGPDGNGLLPLNRHEQPVWAATLDAAPTTRLEDLL